MTSWARLGVHRALPPLVAGSLVGLLVGTLAFAGAKREHHAPVAILGSELGLPPPADHWAVVRRGGFSVALPGVPEEQLVALGAHAANRISTRADVEFYGVYDVQLASDVPPLDPSLDPSLEDQNVTLVAERKFVRSGAPAVHVVKRRSGSAPMRFEAETVVLRSRQLVLVLVVVGPESRFPVERAAQFFGSLALLDAM